MKEGSNYVSVFRLVEMIFGHRFIRTTFKSKKPEFLYHRKISLENDEKKDK